MSLNRGGWSNERKYCHAEFTPLSFARIEKKIEEARQQGWDVISLGIGDPDQPTPEHIIAALVEASETGKSPVSQFRRLAVLPGSCGPLV